MSLLEIPCSSRSSYVLRLRRFVVEVFDALEAWIRWTSLIYDFLRFLEAFELDSGELWDLRRRFGWFLFECSLYLKVCSRSSSGLWRLESVEFHWFVIWWCFWTFELNSRKLLDLCRWFGWFCFECSPILGLKFLNFLEASGLDSNKVFSLLNLGPPKCLRKASIYRSLEVGEQHVAELIGDTCHSLIGSLMSSLTRVGLLESSLTRAGLDRKSVV